MVDCDPVRSSQVYEVITVSVLFTQILVVARFLVSPHEFRNFLNI